MEDFEYPQLKPQDIDTFIYQVQNKKIDSTNYLKALEGFIYQFDVELNPPLDYIAQREYEFILILQEQLKDKSIIIEWKILIINILCNIFQLSSFCCEYFCENGGIVILNDLCSNFIQSETDKTNFRRLSDIALACIGTCIEYQPDQSLISLQNIYWVNNLFQIYQKPAQFRSLANYISLLISNSPQDQKKVIIPQVCQIFTNLFNYNDPVVYSFLLKGLKNIKDKDTLILLADQKIVAILLNYLIQIQSTKQRVRSMILQFLYILSTHEECHKYFQEASFQTEKLTKLNFMSQSNNVVAPKNSNQNQINTKDDNQNSIVFLLGIISNLVKQNFNQEFFTQINTITQTQIRNFTIVDSVVNLLKNLLLKRGAQDAVLIFNYLKNTLLSNAQTKVYLQNNTRFQSNILQLISQLSQLDTQNQEIKQWQNEISNIQPAQMPVEDTLDQDIDELTNTLANMDLSDFQNLKKNNI